VVQVSLCHFIYFFSNNQNYQFLDIKLSDKIIGVILYFVNYRTLNDTSHFNATDYSIIIVVLYFLRIIVF